MEDTKGTSGKRELFKSSNWRDLFWAILFYVQLAVYLGYLGYRALAYKSSSENVEALSATVSLKVLVPVGLSIAGWTFASVLLTLLTSYFIYCFPAIFLSIFFFLLPLLTFGITIQLRYITIFIPLASVFLLFIGTLFYLGCRKDIPLSAKMLRMAIECTAREKTVIIVPFFAAFVSTLHAVSVSLCVYDCFTGATRSSVALLGKLLLLAISFFWTHQVISNVCHTTISGVFATYYFGMGLPDRLKNATGMSFVRAMTYSFGSVCLGSLIVAIVQIIHFLVKQDGDSITAVFASCFLDIIEDLVSRFNYYAYTQVAIYGKPYFEAAKDSWQLIKSRGLHLLINDDMVECACLLASAAIAVTVGIFAHLFADRIVPGGWKVVGYKISANVGYGIFCGFASFFASQLMFSVLTSGVTSLFVCLAEDPTTLKMGNQELYDSIREAYGSFFIL